MEFLTLGEVYVLDKPAVNQKLADVTKKVWFDRGYRVTNWRKENFDSWHVNIGNFANEDGSLVIEHKRVSESLGLRTISKTKKRRGWSSHLEGILRTMVEQGKIRLVESNDGILDFYQLTLTSERQPAQSPEIISIEPMEYAPTKYCFCSNNENPYAEFYFGCEICRNSALSIIKSYYGGFWLEFESAVTRRENPKAPGLFDQAKVNLGIREEITNSIAHVLHLCSKTRAFVTPVDVSRLFWLVSEAQNRIHLNPQYFPNHSRVTPDPSIGFLKLTDKLLQAKQAKSDPLANRLEHLTSLYKKGLITVEEFSNKKKELLEEI